LKGKRGPKSTKKKKKRGGEVKHEPEGKTEKRHFTQKLNTKRLRLKKEEEEMELPTFPNDPTLVGRFTVTGVQTLKGMACGKDDSGQKKMGNDKLGT